MNLNQQKRLTIGFVILLTGGVASFAYVTSYAQNVPQAGAQDNVLTAIAGYRNWTRVNKPPLRSNNFLIEGRDS